VNDTAKDATYYANPLLPGASGGGITLKVGERIVGVWICKVRDRTPSRDSLRTLHPGKDQLGVAW
jgi:hypothetical protein